MKPEYKMSKELKQIIEILVPAGKSTETLIKAIILDASLYANDCVLAYMDKKIKESEPKPELDTIHPQQLRIE